MCDQDDLEEMECARRIAMSRRQLVLLEQALA